MSAASDDRRMVDRQAAAERLYAQAKVRQDRLATDKENTERSAASAAAPHINPRSKMIQRMGPVGERLHLDAQDKAALQEALAEHARQRKLEEERASENDGRPAINEVSSQLMRDRSGDVVDRLYAHAKVKGKDMEKREAAHMQQIQANARPELSAGSQRIVANLPDREAPVQERLYAEAGA